VCSCGHLQDTWNMDLNSLKISKRQMNHPDKKEGNKTMGMQFAKTDLIVNQVLNQEKGLKTDEEISEIENQENTDLERKRKFLN